MSTQLRELQGDFSTAVIEPPEIGIPTPLLI